MPPSERPIPMYVAEPPQEPLPYGRWAEALREHFLQATPDESRAELGEITWFPDRTWGARTYVPGVAPSGDGGEVCGYVSYLRSDQGAQAGDFEAGAYYTEDTAEANPDWKLDLSDLEVADWRGPEGRRGKLTLVWGAALVPNGAVATVELGPTTTDQCILVEGRFTLLSLDAYTGDYVEVRLYGRKGMELAVEALYEEE
ncbi:MAG: hypothetical protein ABR581_08685 [Thermoleophilaceae bacterium]